MNRSPLLLPPHTLALVPRRTVYGAAELTRAMGPNLLKGLVVGCGALGVALGAAASLRASASEVPARSVREVVLMDRPAPPPSIPPARAVPAAPPKATADAPKVGEITPIPDDQADPSVRVADQGEMHAGPPSPNGVDGGTGYVEGGAVGVAAPATPVDTVQRAPVLPLPLSTPTPQPAETPKTTGAAEDVVPAFVPVEVQPQIVERVEPRYPDLLRRAGVEGRVVVRVLVGTDGRAERVEVLRSDHEGFDAATVEAVRRWRFAPAVQAGQPVRVWMTVPVRYRQQR